MSDEGTTSKSPQAVISGEGTANKGQPVKRRRISSMDELKVGKKYCFDDLEFDETEEDGIHEKCSLLIKKIGEGVSVAKLEGLAFCIGKLKLSGLSKALSFDELSNLLKKLTDTIKKGINGNPNKDGKKITEMNSLAVRVCLDIYACEDMPTALYVEDCINDIILYFKHQIDELHSHFSKKISGSKKRTNSLPSFVHSLIKNLGYLDKFVRLRHFTSPFLFNLITSCIFTVFHVFVYDVQMAVILLLRSIFEKREEFRAFIINDVFGTIKKVAENHKFVKNFGMGTIRISMFSVLVLSLVQSMANLKKIDEKILKESYEGLLKTGGSFAVAFVGCCGSDIDHHKTFRTILDFFIGELIEISNEPEWPASKIILQFLAKPCTELVKAKSNTDIMLRIFAVKVLNKIAGKIIQNKKLEVKAEELLVEFDNIEDLTKKEVAELLLISYLKEKELLEVNDNCKYVYQVQWFENRKHEDGFEEKKEFIINLLKKSNLIDKKISREEARGLVHYLDSKKFNYADYHVFLNYILVACYDPNKKMKAVGAQCLGDLVSLDSNLLSRSVVSKTVNECLSASSAVGREAICKLLDKFLAAHPEKAGEYDLYLLKLLSDDFISVRKASINAVKNLLLKKIDVPHAKELIYKILGLLRDEETSIQKEAVEFCKLLWLDENKFKKENVDLLLEIVEMPNALKNLKMFFEEKLRLKGETRREPETVQSAQSQPDMESCLQLARYLIEKMKMEEFRLPSLKIISIIATVRPGVLNSFALEIAMPLNETAYSKDFGVEILTAETLNYVLPEMVNPDVLALALLIDKIIDKLNGDESLNYTKGFMVSLIKLLKKLEKYGSENFLLEKLLEPNLEVLKEYLKSGKIEERVLIRAICITTYLHVDIEDENKKKEFVGILEKFLQNPNYVLATIHSICYLSIEYKLIMKNEVLRSVLATHLKDRKKQVLTQAALYNILRSLENLKEEDNNEVTSELIQTYLQQILECSLEPNYEVRHTAFMLISHVLKSGLLMESRFVPYVVTMSSDPILENRAIGQDVLKLIHGRKTYDVSRNPQTGILLSRKLISKISGAEFVRGYREQNGKIEARCNLLYALHQEDETKRRRLTEAILNELKTDSATTITEKLYLIDNLANFAYKYQDEVLYLLRQIEHTKSVTIIPEESPQDKLKFVKEYYGIFLLNPLKNYLQKLYGINDQKIAKYYGVETKKDLVTKRVGVKYFINEKMLPVGNENFAEMIYQAVKQPDGSDSQSSNDDMRKSMRSPIPGTPKIRLKKSVLTELQDNVPKRLTKSEQKPKRNMAPKFNSAKKIKLSEESKPVKINQPAAAKSLF